MKILVLGGAGFLGTHLVHRCLDEANAEVTVLDSLEPRLLATAEHLRPVWDRIRFVQGSMTDQPVVSQVVQGQDVIFNCAAQTSHPLSLRDPLFDAEINCLGNLRVLEAIRQLNPRATVVYTSSSTVIGRAVAPVVDELHGEQPLDIYSANKGVAEKYYRIYHRVHGLKTVVLRFANLYGPWGKGSPDFGFVNHFIHQAWTAQELRVFGPGDQQRNLLYAGDAAEALFRAAQEPRLLGEVLFATHHEHLSVDEVARRVVEVLGRGTVTHVDWPDLRRRFEVESVRFTSERLHQLLGWRPTFDFTAGLQRTKAILERENVR